MRNILGRAAGRAMLTFILMTCSWMPVQVEASLLSPSLGSGAGSAFPAQEAGGDPCANKPDPLGCYREMKRIRDAGLQQHNGISNDKEHASGNSRGMPAPVVHEEPGEFERFVAASLGKKLPIYGAELFVRAPDTFSPLDNVPVTADYLIGPGDELVVRGWGQVSIDMSVVVDRNGFVYLPEVGNVNVAGVRYSNLQAHMQHAIGKVFRNFELNVTMGKLRSIQVFVVGQARQPGVYTVSSLSTLINTLFASGGPSSKGSMRHIQVKRNGEVVTELDMYDFLLKGDKTKDVALLPGDVIYIPPVGSLAAISGSVRAPAIFELKDAGGTLNDLIEMAGGLSTVAEGEKVRVERIDDRKTRRVDEFALDAEGLVKVLKDGDVVQVGAITGEFGNAVTLRGNVASPGRYPWREGMRITDLIPSVDALITPEFWAGKNNAQNVDVNSETKLAMQIKRNQNEVNWDYALLERLDKENMTNALLPFNLGKAIREKDPDQNLILQPGDVVTIFSQNDIQVPVARRSVYVRLEGEFKHPGVYKALPGETLRQLVARVAGVTPQAYMFASELTRESTRQIQQKRLDEMLDKMELDINRRGADAASGALSKDDVAAAESQIKTQRELIAKMRLVKASGRIVLDLPGMRTELKDLPDLELEDGDRFYVPSVNSTVTVMGAVYNQNAFLYKKGLTVNDYLERSGGPTRDGDDNDVYLVRVDGTVVSSRNSGFFSGSLGGHEVLPGAAIVVPEKLEKYNLTKDFKDWTQIFYQFAIGIASLKTIGIVR